MKCQKKEKVYFVVSILLVFVLINSSASPAKAANWVSNSYYDYVGTSQIDTTSLSVMGINVPDSYSQNFVIKKKTNISYDTFDGVQSVVCTFTTAVFVFPNGASTYDVWSWAEICPGTITRKNSINKKTVYNVIPDDLTIYSYVPTYASYVSSTPKNQVPKTSYSIGGGVESSPSAGGSSYGLSANASVTVEKNALEINNRSNSGSNLFKVVFDYQMTNNYVNSSVGNFLKNTNENLAEFVFTSSKNTNSFNISFDLTLGYETKTLFYFNMWGYGEGMSNKISQLRQIEIHK